jgi:excisionase family DNA binding protein
MSPSAPSGGKTASPQKGSNPRRRGAGPRVPLLGIDDVAQWLGVEVGFVRRLIAQRRIPFVKIGRYVRFDPEDVSAWIDGRRVTPDRLSDRPIRRGSQRNV